MNLPMIYGYDNNRFFVFAFDLASCCKRYSHFVFRKSSNLKWYDENQLKSKAKLAVLAF